MRTALIVVLLLSLLCVALAAGRPQKALSFKAKHNANARMPRFRHSRDNPSDPTTPPAAPASTTSASANAAATPPASTPGGPVVEATTPPVSCNDCKAVLALINGHLHDVDQKPTVDDGMCSTIMLCPASDASTDAVKAAPVPDKAADTMSAADAASDASGNY